MTDVKMEVLERLDREDREKVAYFVTLLVSQAKYRRLREEIEKRMPEVERGEVLEHEEIWKQLNI
ncbi:MAG: hypothetical protein DRI93_02360 [Aquificota bacterium]|nr:MAG: hypothetical protein DRI93_02360 [Aquificota bacterium]RLD97359.1 MAG: hypothetical protein DRI91_05360 [Aquificota bacterium]